MVAFYRGINFVGGMQDWAGLLRCGQGWQDMRQRWPRGWITTFAWWQTNMLTSDVQTDVLPYLLCKCVAFGQSMADVNTAECRQIEFGFLCICSDRCTTIPDRDTKNRISISEFGTFSLTFSFSYHVSWSFLSSLTEYLNVLCSITLKNTSSFLKHCLLLPGGLLLSQKLPSFPFLQLLKMGAVRLRLTTDLLSRGSFQFSELCYSLLAVLDSALNI